MPRVTYYCVLFIRRTFLIFFKIWARMERVLRIRYELLRTLRMRYVYLRIVMECTDRCGWALRNISRVRKCVCDWGIKFDMQRHHVLKKLNFDHLIPPPRSEGVRRQNICYHVAAFVIPFNLVCNMTMSCKH